MIWLPVFILAWLLRLAVFLPLAIIGVPLLYLLAQVGHVETRRSKRFDRYLLQWRPPFGLYCNDEDGIDGLRGNDPAQQWWADKTASWSPQKRIWVWSALRNPVDSLRWVRLLNPRIDPTHVRFVGMDHEPAKGENGWYLAWLSGTPYSCIRVERQGWRFWLGWKLKPEDRNGLQSSDVRTIRCDFACQAKRVAR